MRNKINNVILAYNMALTITTNTGVNLCKFSGLPILRSPFLQKWTLTQFPFVRMGSLAMRKI